LCSSVGVSDHHEVFIFAARPKHYSLAFQIRGPSSIPSKPFGIRGGQSGIGTLFLPVIWNSLVSIITVMRRAHILFIYHRRCMILANYSVVKRSIYLHVSNKVYFRWI
jgi:hypothetical protein